MAMAISELDKPVVSVCIANYNGADVIEACIRSVKAQDCDFKFEIIVHDDASTDRSANLIREHFPGVLLIISETNVGYCVSNNRMVALARGEFILLLNNDAELFPDALSTLHKAALKISLPTILGLPQYDAASGELVDVGSLFDPFLNPIPNHDLSRKEVGMVIGACFWISKTLWRELGGFPEWFGSIAEDMFLCCYARLAGHSVHALSISGYRHWQGKSFGGGKAHQNHLSTTFRRRALSERNKSYVMVLCYPATFFLILFPLHLLLLMMEGAMLTLLKRDIRLWGLIYQPCLNDLWRERYHLAIRRNAIQASRSIRVVSFLKVFKWYPQKLAMLWQYGLPKIR